MDRYIDFKPGKDSESNRDLEGKYYIFNGDKLVLTDKGLLLDKDLEEVKTSLENLQYLGERQGINYYSGEIIGRHNYIERDFRDYIESIDEWEFYIASKARLLLNYYRDNKNCGRCGEKTYIKEEGNDRAIVCPSCNHMVWPKTAPAIIVAITKGDQLLLAHNNNFKKGFYSVLAGFVEMGETFEDCVRREVMEEVGIKVRNIKYFGSQPWAFPNSMMVAFTAEYSDGEIEIDEDEIAHADWFSKEEVRSMYKESVSIGSKLIKWFLEKK